MLGMEQYFEAHERAEIVAETRTKNWRDFIIIRMRSYLLKEQLPLQSTGTSF